MRLAITFMLCSIVPVALLAQSEAFEKGRGFLEQKRAELGLNQDHEFRARKANATDYGATHVRFDQYFRGVKVFEGEGIVHFEADGSVGMTDGFLRGIDLDVTPSISEAAARLTASRVIGVLNPNEISSSLEILTKGERSTADRLVWHVKTFHESDQTGPISYDIFVDAKSGQVAWLFNSLETTAVTVTGGGKTMYLGNVNLYEDFVSPTYYMRSPNQANLRTTDMFGGTSGTGTTFSNTTGIFGNNVKDLSNRATAGADAHYGMTKTWEYFKNTFGRNGINNAGSSSYGRVHYSTNYQNAFWSSSCFCMTYGDGGSTFYPLVSLDVTGHEMAHGVMASEANLTYSGESGGLNESSSDIFGTLVEYYVNNTLDVPDYWIGERIYKSNWSGGTYVQSKALRYMTKPSLDGASPNCWSSTIGNLDVHYSSGPNNHMFYLLSAGGTSACNGSAVTGIGRSSAARIWYDAVANRMTASTNYKGARTACLNSATALFGTGSTQYNAVAAAYSAINVN